MLLSFEALKSTVKSFWRKWSSDQGRFSPISDREHNM